MPRYYFHILADRETELDDLGVELPDMEAARSEALKTIAGFMLDAALSNCGMPGHAFSITDAQGTHLLTVPFDVMARQRRVH